MEAEYIVLSDENEAYVIEMAADIEKKISSIINANPRVSMLMATTLAAMEYCDTANKATIAADNLRSQIKDYLDESSKSRARAEDDKKELVKLKQEVQDLKAKLAEAKAKLAEAKAAEVKAPANDPKRVEQNHKSINQINKELPKEENPSNRQVTSPSPISRPVKTKSTPASVNGTVKVTQLGKADEEIMDFFDQRCKK